MNQRKQERQHRALNRFRVQTETEWNKDNKQIAGTYDDYVQRKTIEREKLERSI